MSTTFWNGKELKDIELLNLFEASEGEITQYYGRIGGGKTYAATSDVLDLLRRGEVVYTNWRINYSGYDQRNELPYIILGMIWPLKKNYYSFPKDNLRHIEVDEEFHEKFEKLTDCHVFLDEGHVAFDSYEMARLDIKKRNSVLHTRHYNRSIHIISQRPTAVHVAMRANVNRFYKCMCYFKLGGIRRFKRVEYQDMQNETVDEQPEKIVSIKRYWGSKKVFEAYDTKYLRGQIKASQKVLFKAYKINYIGRVLLFFRHIFGKRFDYDHSPTLLSEDTKIKDVPRHKELDSRSYKKSIGKTAKNKGKMVVPVIHRQDRKNTMSRI